MFKPVGGLLVAVMLLTVGCASNPTVESESSPPAVSSPETTPNVAAAPASPAARNAQSSPQSSTVAQAPSIDTTVVPGQRVGPITRSTSRSDLAQLFGEENLKDQDIPGGEGETEPGTIVDLGPQQSFTVIWTNNNRSQLAAVVDLGPAWKTPQGIGVGTPFAQLQEKLGAFQLYGFDWDYGGTISLEGSQLSQYYGLLILRVEPAPDAAEKAPQDYEAVTGDQLFPSTSPHFQNLGLRVSEMAVYLSPRTE